MLYLVFFLDSCHVLQLFYYICSYHLICQLLLHSLSELGAFFCLATPWNQMGILGSMKQYPNSWFWWSGHLSSGVNPVFFSHPAVWAFHWLYKKNKITNNRGWKEETDKHRFRTANSMYVPMVIAITQQKSYALPAWLNNLDSHSWLLQSLTLDWLTNILHPSLPAL